MVSETEGIDDCMACEMRNRQDLTSKHTRCKVNERPKEWACKNREDAQDSDILLSGEGKRKNEQINEVELPYWEFNMITWFLEF